MNQFNGEPPAAGANLDDPIDVRGEPFEDRRMQPLSLDEPVVEFGLQTVEQLPGERGVLSRIGWAVTNEPSQLVGGEDGQVARGISLPGRPRLRRTFRPL